MSPFSHDSAPGPFLVARMPPRRRLCRSRRPSLSPAAERLEGRTLLSTVTVHVFNFDFSVNPSGQTIVDPTIQVGDAIHWVWDSGFHSTTSVTGQAESWNSGDSGTIGNTFDHTFTHSGTFWYYCDIHGADLGNGTASGMAGTITVLAAPTLTSIAVTPVDPNVPKGLTQQYTAMGTYSDNSHADLTAQVTWASSNPAIATITNAAGSRGVATAVAKGTSTIAASLGGITGTTVMTVSPAVLQSIAVAPVDPSVPKGRTQPFTASGTYSDNSHADITTQVTWASSDASVATVSNASGAHGLATALGTGPSTITATLDGVIGSTSLTVTAAVLQSIELAPVNPDLPKGRTQPFTATGTYSDDSHADITVQVTWASSDTAVATIDPAGLARGKAIGTTTISALLDGITGATGLTVSAAVLQSIAVAPANPSVPKGDTQSFTATGTYSDDSAQDITGQVAWASSDATVATISNASGTKGRAIAAAVGSTTMSAVLEGITGSTILTVSAAVLRSIAITPGNPSIAKGDPRAFTATGTYSDSSTQDITGQVTWASGTAAVATISNAPGSKGLASTLGTGSTTITATVGGIIGSTELVIGAAVLRSIVITPDSPTIAKGETKSFAATGIYSDHSTQDLTGQVTWVSDDPSAATISNGAGSQGMATAVDVGMAMITASRDGLTGTTMLMIDPARLLAIEVKPAGPSLGQGGAQQFTAIGTFSDQSTGDLTSQVRWDSSNPTLATVMAGGLVMGQAAGTATISASFGGVTGSTTLSVTGLPASLPTPPVTVTGVRILRNKKRQVTEITVDLSGAVHPSEAASLASFLLTTAGKHGSFLAKGATAIRLKAALYDVALHQVTLTPRKPFVLKKAVEVTVKGQPPDGLHDEAGRFIDGDRDGKEGGDARFVLSRKGGAAPWTAAMGHARVAVSRAARTGNPEDPPGPIGLAPRAEIAESRSRSRSG